MLVGQNADARGTGGLISPRDGERVEIRADHACRRGGPLDFRNQADAVRGACRVKRSEKVADSRRVRELPLELRGRDYPLGDGDFVPLVCHNAF